MLLPLIQQGDTGTGKSEILHMLSILDNSDSNLLPNFLQKIRELAEHLLNATSHLAGPHLAAHLILKTKSSLSVKAVAELLFAEMKDLTYGDYRRATWSSAILAHVRDLFKTYTMLEMPPYVVHVLARDATSTEGHLAAQPDDQVPTVPPSALSVAPLLAPPRVLRSEEYVLFTSVVV